MSTEENGIQIVASDIEMVGISELQLGINKVKEHSVDQIAMLAGMMQEFGFTVPILVDDKNNVIAGKGRVLAAKSLSMERVPAVRTTHLSDNQVRALIIADNKITESPWDLPELKLEMGALKEIDDELLAMTGFDFEEIDELLDGAITEECDDGEEDEKPDFLNFGSHKIELEPQELKELNAMVNLWVKKTGSYKGAVRAIIDDLQGYGNGSFGATIYSKN